MSKINLEGFKFIPQSYTATGTASLEDLNVFSLEPKVKQPESVVPIKRIKDGFVQFDKNFFPFSDGKGYTAAISPENELFLFRSDLTEKGIMKPHFLKGAKPVSKVKSTYLNLLLDTLFPANIVELYTTIVSEDVWKVSSTIPVIDTTLPEEATQTIASIVEVPLNVQNTASIIDAISEQEKEEPDTFVIGEVEDTFSLNVAEEISEVIPQPMSTETLLELLEA